MNDLVFWLAIIALGSTALATVLVGIVGLMRGRSRIALAACVALITLSPALILLGDSLWHEVFGYVDPSATAAVLESMDTLRWLHATSWISRELAFLVLVVGVATCAWSTRRA